MPKASTYEPICNSDGKEHGSCFQNRSFFPSELQISGLKLRFARQLKSLAKSQLHTLMRSNYNGVYAIDGPWQGKLAIITRPRGNEWLQDEMSRLKKSGFDTILSLLEQNESAELGLVQEKAAVEANNMQWLSFPIPDRGVPASLWRTVELVQRINQSLSDGQNVAIHCRQGVGRSAMIAAALLVLQNVSTQKISVTNAFERIQRVRGTSVPDTVGQRDWVEALTKLEKVPTL